MTWFHLVEAHWYTLAVLIAGLWVMWRVSRSLRHSEVVTKAALAARKAIQAVPNAKGTRPTEEVKKRGVRSIEQRFTVTRRLLLPTIGVAILALAALPFLDRVPATALSLLVAIATVVLGVAARPGLENAVSGLVMSYSNVLRLGDTVSLDGFYGTVEDISSTHTTIRVWDSRRYVVPNSQMLRSKLLNYTLFDQQIWACVEFWVAYDADLDQARQIALEVAASSPFKVGEQPPAMWVLGLESQGIRCWLAAWADNAAEAWSFTDDVRTRLARRFRHADVFCHGFRYVASPPLTSAGPHMPSGPGEPPPPMQHYMDGRAMGETPPVGIEMGLGTSGNTG